MSENKEDYSPFDAPVKEPKTITPETSGGIKMEEIKDSELDGKGKPNDPPPTDAPTFEIPKFDEIPNADFSKGDPNAPGSAGAGAGPGSSGGGGGGTGTGTAGDGTKVDPGFMKEFSDFSAKWLVDIFFRLLVNALRQFAKIDKSEIVKAVNEGYIDARFLNFVDEANEKADKNIYVTDDEKKFVIEPLKYFLEVKKIQLKPEWMFITGLLFVGGGLAVRAWDLKQQNKELLDHMIKETAKWKERERTGQPAAAGSGRRNDQYHRENVETFSGGEPSFTPPPPTNDGNIEVVQTEEVDNDDNA